MGMQTYTNNPGNLTTGRASAGQYGPVSGSILYPGQTGNYAANGLIYATFPDVTTGWNALTDYVSRHIASGWTTITQFVQGYFGGTLAPTADNPDPGGYIKAVTQGSGLSATQTLTQVNVSQVAAGIARGEGNASEVQGMTATSQSAAQAAATNPFASVLGSFGNWISNNDPLQFNFGPSNVIAGANAIGQIENGTASAQQRAAVASVPGGGAIAGAATAAGAAAGLLQGLTVSKIALTVLGVGVIIVALYLLGTQTKLLTMPARATA